MASGDTLLIFTPASNEPPAADFATIDSVNAQSVLDFDAAVTEGAVFGAPMPAYAGGGLTVELHYWMDTATTGGVRWDLSIEAKNEPDPMGVDSFAAPQSVSRTPVVGTAGNLMIDTITFTNGAQMDNAAVGNGLRFLLQRDHDHPDDDATGDASFRYLEVRET